MKKYGKTRGHYEKAVNIAYMLYSRFIDKDITFTDFETMLLYRWGYLEKIVKYFDVNSKTFSPNSFV